jgi:hypothetical protein
VPGNQLLGLSWCRNLVRFPTAYPTLDSTGRGYVVVRYNDLQLMITMAQKSKSARRLASARENGSQGGRERASRYSDEQLSAWASQGGEAVLHKYGPDYFVNLRKRRKNYPKYSESPVVRPNWRARIAWENGQKGGLARAARYSYEHFREWGRLGGIETWCRYGNKFYREIRKRRKYYEKNYFTRKTIMRLRRRCEREARKAKGGPTAWLWKLAGEGFAKHLSQRSHR